MNARGWTENPFTHTNSPPISHSPRSPLLTLFFLFFLESPLNDAHALFSFPDAPSPTSSSSSTFSPLTATPEAATFTPILTGSTITPSPADSTAVLSHGFGSDAINLEYSILSTMLSSPATEFQPMSELSMVENWQRQGAIEAMANSLQHQHQHQAHLQLSALTQHQQPQQQQNGANNSTSQPVGTTRGSKRKAPSNTPENVYANTKQAFNYTDGFHYLLRYLRERYQSSSTLPSNRREGGTLLLSLPVILCLFLHTHTRERTTKCMHRSASLGVMMHRRD